MIDISLIKGNVRVNFESIGEGLQGEYDPTDPDDIDLIRFSVDRDANLINYWTYVDDSSYCCQYPTDCTDEQKVEGLMKVMGAIYKPVTNGESIKKICEKLSWIGIEKETI